MKNKKKKNKEVSEEFKLKVCEQIMNDLIDKSLMEIHELEVKNGIKFTDEEVLRMVQEHNQLNNLMPVFTDPKKKKEQIDRLKKNN
ncbi:hypothetical protein COB55_04360 [Candidatus Wolfebacteria bacterium]|nr:MAG: hypothetical protein COB55_04360 [Candidatus Wolfebacteria bacterium]